MNKLTEEQKKLVEDNIKLATHMATKLYHPHIELDDAIQIARIGLCKAAVYFDKSLGYKFSSFAGKIIINELHMEERKFYSTKHVRTWASYDRCIKEKEDGSIISLLSEDITSYYIVNCSITQIRKSLSKRDKEIFDRCVLYSETQESVAKDLNISQSYVSRRAKLLRSMAKSTLYEEGVI